MKNAENKQQPTAAEAYKTAKNDIASLLGWFECELAKEPKEMNWAEVGSLNKVRRDLIETLTFLSGIDEKQIEESLEDARTLDDAK